MKKVRLLLFVVMVLCIGTSCGTKEEVASKEPKEAQVKAICELAVMDCYYHNVAKYFEEDAAGVLFWKKDKNFWIEYSGVVRIGLDASQIAMEIKDNEVTVTLPPAKVMNCTVDQNSLTEESYIIADDSAKPDSGDGQTAFTEAQENMRKEAESDSALLASAQQRAQNLIEEYVMNIGNAVGKEYIVKWKYLSS